MNGKSLNLVIKKKQNKLKFMIFNKYMSILEKKDILKGVI